MNYNEIINKLDIKTFNNLDQLKDFLRYILKEYNDKDIYYYDPIWINWKIWICYWIFDKWNFTLQN